MPTFHLHFKGIVQGVGFRPFVYEAARKISLNGWVKNSGKGLEIRITTDEKKARNFFRYISENAPPHSLITGRSFKKVSDESFEEFRIDVSTSEDTAEALLPPDIALCENCRSEMRDSSNRRRQYAFITCVHCGPRYSIINGLPYDRPQTTMAHLEMCAECTAEYEKPGELRQHSQTNSCPECAIPMFLYNKNGELESSDQETIITHVTDALLTGKTVAVKGIGGFLLMVDATNEQSIKTLRERKQRPAKPFAVMYPGLEMARGDAVIRPHHEAALKSAASPVVLCERKENPATGLCGEAVAPGLGTVGVMIPYSPLFELILSRVRRPLIATSANLSGSPIIYQDEEALKHLGHFADFILVFGRDIVAPQDDSVVQFSSRGGRIILRRSRGMAPNYNPYPFRNIREPVLGVGADLKGAFAFADQHKLIVSQFLGNQESYDSQLSFQNTLNHIKELYSFEPKIILADAHPVYHSRRLAEQLSKQLNIRLISVQHHIAHFTAVLAENGLLHSKNDCLGFIWDGTGYGNDGQVWGGEVFLRNNSGIQRAFHLSYFPVLAGDKMSLEPRLSALSVMKNLPDTQSIIQNHFSEKEWVFYQKLLRSEPGISTSSMGRLLDAVGCLLGCGAYNTYESEVAMKLENLARNVRVDDAADYSIQIKKNELHWEPMIAAVLADIKNDRDNPAIAAGVFRALAEMVYNISRMAGIKKLAFSGGVFQNAVLVDYLLELKPAGIELYFHKQLSPNDENIGFGQIAYYDRYVSV